MRTERWIYVMRMRLRSVFRREVIDHELEEELRYHVERKTEENIARGMTAAEARRVALMDAGGIDQAKEKCRDTRGVKWIHDFAQDLRFGFRMLQKNPGFTAVAVLTLALGIGANTAIFGLIDALLLRSLPVHDPQGVVVLKWSALGRPKHVGTSTYGDCELRMGAGDVSGCGFSHPFFNQLRGANSLFSSVTASASARGLDLTGNGDASVAQGLLVEGNYFSTLGVKPALGRMIEPSDLEPSAEPVTVLRYGYWQSAFGGSSYALGKVVGINGIPTTIVGVADEKFSGLTPGGSPDIWVPISLRGRLNPRWNAPDADSDASWWMLIVARRRADVSQQQAEGALSLLFRNDTLHRSQAFLDEVDMPAVELVPISSRQFGQTRRAYSTPLFILMFAVGTILLISSANVAGLLLSRSRTRQKEIAVRLALGAGRARIVRQLLTESALLSMFGGALGIVFAIWGARVIAAWAASGSSQPLDVDPSIDLRVLAFTAAVSLLAAVIFGLAPAMQSTRIELTSAMKDGASNSRVGNNRWMNARNALVIGQVALTMIVMVGAGLTVRTLGNLRNIDPGFDPSNVLNFSVNPTLIGYRGAGVDGFYRDLQSRLRAIPGVVSVSYSLSALLSGGLGQSAYHLIGGPDESVDSDSLPVGADFFSTMKIAVVEGRDFSTADFVAASAVAAASTPNATGDSAAKMAPRSAIVNQTFVRRYLAGTDPLGQRFETPGAVNDPGYVIVGVVRDAKYNDLRREVYSTTYIPDVGGGVVFELRATSDSNSIVPAVRSIVHQLDANVPVSNVMTESESIDRLLFQERMIARLSSFFGGLALLLACVGLYGLLSYEVTRRTREIGIRMALGAGPRDVLENVMGQGLALAVAGLAVGVAASFGVTRFLGSILFGVHPADPATLIAVTGILLLVAFVACWIPARRAMRVDPMVALRHE